jgi:hypothetical protein
MNNTMKLTTKQAQAASTAAKAKRSMSKGKGNEVPAPKPLERTTDCDSMGDLFSAFVDKIEKEKDADGAATLVELVTGSQKDTLINGSDKADEADSFNEVSSSYMSHNINLRSWLESRSLLFVRRYSKSLLWPRYILHFL